MTALNECPTCGDQSDKDHPNEMALDDPQYWDEDYVYIPAYCECGEVWTEIYDHVATRHRSTEDVVVTA